MMGNTSSGYEAMLSGITPANWGVNLILHWPPQSHVKKTANQVTWWQCWVAIGYQKWELLITLNTLWAVIL